MPTFKTWNSFKLKKKKLNVILLTKSVDPETLGPKSAAA